MVGRGRPNGHKGCGLITFVERELPKAMAQPVKPLAFVHRLSELKPQDPVAVAPAVLDLCIPARRRRQRAEKAVGRLERGGRGCTSPA